MSKKALLIGINYVGTNSALRGCINDVLNVKQFLTTNYGLTEQDMVILTEAAGNPDLLPTKANILKQIAWLTQGANANSRLFIHYSGHGCYIRDTSGDENDQRDECICPLDFQKTGLITDDQLRQVLVDPLPKGAQLFGIFDCCHSGTILDLRYNYLFNANPKQNTYNVQIENKVKDSRCKVTLISGCLDTQTSADAWIERKAQGALTYSFLKMYHKLKRQKKSLTCQRLMKDLNVFVKRGGFKQIPKLSTGHLINLNEKIAIL